jgi:hypothetical protein
MPPDGIDQTVQETRVATPPNRLLGMLVVLQVPEAMRKNRAGEQSHHQRHI